MKPVIQYYAHILRQHSVPVDKVDPELVKDMADFQGRCLGLAAVQLGVLARLIMVRYGDEYLFLANPEIVKASPKATIMREGCLSIGYGREYHPVPRSKRVKVRYMDIEGNQKTVKAEGTTARALQHEIDHLDGKLIFDYEEAMRGR